MAEPKRSGLYIIRHTSGAFYVGRSANMGARFANHRWALRNRSPRNRRLRELVERVDVSADQFSFSILLVCSPSDLAFYEDRALAVYMADPNCLNIVSVGGKHDEVACAKISAANKGRVSSRRGRRPSAEARARMSEAARSRKPSPSPFRGRKRPDIAASLRGQKHSADRRSRLSERMTQWWAERKRGA